MLAAQAEWNGWCCSRLARSSRTSLARPSGEIQAPEKSCCLTTSDLPERDQPTESGTWSKLERILANAIVQLFRGSKRLEHLLHLRSIDHDCAQPCRDTRPGSPSGRGSCDATPDKPHQVLHVQAHRVWQGKPPLGGKMWTSTSEPVFRHATTRVKAFA